MSDLLPCPFCGRQPQFTERDCTRSERSPTGRIYFLACMCGGYSARAHQFGYSREGVAEAWNRRAPGESAPAAVESPHLRCRVCGCSEWEDLADATEELKP